MSLRTFGTGDAPTMNQGDSQSAAGVFINKIEDVYTFDAKKTYTVWCDMSEICLKLKVLAKIDFIVFLTLLGVK